MKVLISGGAKTVNIVRVLEDMLASSGIDFITIPYIENIRDIFIRGEFFDRAILIEQSWTHDDQANNEHLIRSKVNSFANEMIDLAIPSATYVFVSQTESMAGIIHEEIMAIKHNSVLLVKQPKYYAKFFGALAISELDNMPAEYIYNPDNYDNFDNSFGFEENTDTSIESNIGVDDLVNPVGDNNANRLPIDEGFSDWGNMEQGGFGSMNGSQDGSQNGSQDGFESWGGSQNEFGSMNGSQGGSQGGFESWDGSQDGSQDGFESWGGSQDGSQNGFESWDGSQDDSQNGFESWDGSQDGSQNGFESWDGSQDGSQSGFESWDGSQDGFDSMNSSQDGFESWGGSQDGFDSMNGSQNGFDNLGFVDQPHQSGEIPDYSGPSQYNPNQVYTGQGQSQDQQNLNPHLNQYNPNQNNQVNFDQGFVDQSYQSGEIPDYSGPSQYNPNQGYGNQSHQTESNQYNPNQDYGDQSTDFNQYNQGYQDSYYDNYGQYQNDPDPEVGSFDNSLYNDEYTSDDSEIEEDDTPVNRPKLTNKQIKSTFDVFAARGHSIVVTGCGGSGNSTVAFNLANTLCNIGYTVLLVDMDTVNKAQSYISKESFNATDIEGAGVMTAVNSSSGINTYIDVVRQGFHLLTMGMASDAKTPNEAFRKERLSRFVNAARLNHNFIIYDIPFEYATGHLDTVIFSADNIVLTIDSSNWGITKTLINMCNIGSDDVAETMFGRTQLLFNRYRGLSKVMGRKVRKIKDVTKIMDGKVRELIGDDTGYYFSDMHICGSINDDPSFETSWFDDIQYSDTKKGFELFTTILKNIVLHT